MRTGPGAAQQRSAVLLATAGGIAALALAVDNFLGFAGARFLAAPAEGVVIAFAILTGLLGVLIAFRSQDRFRGTAALLFTGFSVSGPPGAGLLLPAAIHSALQAVVPLGFVVVACMSWRSARRRPARIASATTLLFACAWTVGTSVPVPLELFLVVQIVTLAAQMTLVIGNGWTRLVSFVQGLWNSAAVR